MVDRDQVQHPFTWIEFWRAHIPEACKVFGGFLRRAVVDDMAVAEEDDVVEHGVHAVAGLVDGDHDRVPGRIVAQAFQARDNALGLEGIQPAGGLVGKDDLARVPHEFAG